MYYWRRYADQHNKLNTSVYPCQYFIAVLVSGYTSKAIVSGGWTVYTQIALQSKYKQVADQVNLQLP